MKNMLRIDRDNGLIIMDRTFSAKSSIVGSREYEMLTACCQANPTFTVKPGTVHLYHGYREADVNSIVPPGYNDPYSGFPGYRSVPCALRRKEAGP